MDAVLPAIDGLYVLLWIHVVEACVGLRRNDMFDPSGMRGRLKMVIPPEDQNITSNVL
jgi:hypothetical protein